MRNKIFRNLVYVTLFCVCVTFVAMSIFLYAQFFDQMKTEIREEARYAAAALSIDQSAYLDSLNQQNMRNRLTIIGADGTVVYDTEEDASTMENHKDRPEFSEAIATGESYITRQSSTMNLKTLYYAMRLDDGSVLRIACVTSTILTALLSGVPYLVLLLAALGILVLFLSNRQADALLVPLNHLNLDDPLSNRTYEDIMPLLIRIDRQNKANEEQYNQLQAQHAEFDSITSNMNEGLVVYGKKGTILFLNRQARAIFDVTNDALNRDYLVLNRSDTYQRTVQEILQGQHSEALLTLNQKNYRLFGAPVENNDNAAVLLILDVTEQLEREKMRREFTANVSHELKTPLTAIGGYAELIACGIAQPQDVKGFASQIQTQTQNLLKLIDDLIRLSRMEEEPDTLVLEEVDLYQLAENVTTDLADYAKKQNVTVTLEGEAAILKGSPSILSEIIRNLTENAIKYNKPHGTVAIHIASTPEEIIMKIADNGPGIPEEDQSRVFERFYRVDKSHQKKTGGTGLGLSIVKNGVLFHRGSISLYSKEGIGSTFTVSFPKN